MFEKIANIYLMSTLITYLLDSKFFRIEMEQVKLLSGVKVFLSSQEDIYLLI